MKKIEKRSDNKTQNPSEPRKKNINRKKKEKIYSDNPLIEKNVDINKK